MTNKDSFFDNKDLSEVMTIIIQTFQENLPKFLQNKLENGIPLVYADKDNNIVRELPNGEIQLVNHD